MLVVSNNEALLKETVASYPPNFWSSRQRFGPENLNLQHLPGVADAAGTGSHFENPSWAYHTMMKGLIFFYSK